MKRMLLGLLILFTSFNSLTFKQVSRDFHIKAVGVTNVKIFEKKFPQIVKDEKVYLAYLQVFYKDHKKEYLDLFNNRYKYESII